MLDLETMDEMQLTDHPAMDINADWSPDGNEIVFLSNRNGAFHLWTLDTQEYRAKQLTRKALELSHYGYDYAMNVKWSPDGKVIGYIANGEKGRTLGVVDRNGENQRIGVEAIHTFDWSLSSEMVVYN